MPERGPSPDRYALPPELVETIKDDEYACLTLATEQGTALLAKLPASEIEGLRGTFPIQVRHELFDHPASPVIRIITTLYDDPKQPFLLETFINVDDEYQHADYASFADQEDLSILFYDERHHHRLAKTVPNGARERVPQILAAAGDLLAGIPTEQRDFDRAKADVMAAIGLNQARSDSTSEAN